MKKFIPRLFNFICFLLALLVLLPWNQVSLFFVSLSDKMNGNQLFLNVSKFFAEKQSLKIFYIPAFMICVSLLSLIFSGLLKDKNTKTPLSNNIIAPLAYYSIACALFGAITSFYLKNSLTFVSSDYLGLGSLFTSLNYFINDKTYISTTIEWSVFALLIVIIASLFTKGNKTSGAKRFFSFVVFFIIFILAFKGIDDAFGNPGFVNKAGLKETDIMCDGIAKYVQTILAGILLVLYIIVGSAKVKKNNKMLKEVNENPVVVNKEDEKEKEVLNDEEKVTENVEPVAEENKEEEKNTILSEIDSMVAIPKPEDVIETEVEEKTVIKQVVYEQHDLDKMFNTEFGFKHCYMVKKGDAVDYYVNKVKFLTMTNKGHTLSFRLELDKAIRLIIQYPLIGKDKYENHKIWFKIEDIAILSNDVVANIIKDAYETVLSNN